MKLQVNAQPIPVRNTLSATHEIYNRYAGMLLGYLTEVVRDRQLAEHYLVEIFNELPGYSESYFASERSIWVQLQSLAKSRLSSFFESKQDCKVVEEEAKHARDNRIGTRLASMTNLQRTVFCGLYYHNRTVPSLAKELNQSEDTIKRLVKEAFNIIKNDK